MQALQMTVALMLPSIFFSGFIFPLETMPWIFRAISYTLPATYFIDLTRSAVLRGAGWPDCRLDLVVLAAMGFGLFSAAALRFRKRIA
jgi:ABC-2 type transport system permease protein